MIIIINNKHNSGAQYSITREINNKLLHYNRQGHDMI